MKVLETPKFGISCYMYLFVLAVSIKSVDYCIGIGHSFCCSSLSCNWSLPLFCCFCRVLAR